MCRFNAKAMARCGCRNLDLHTLRQHILLGRLVQWWSFSGLLPQYPDANKLKQISQMWQELNQHHKTTCLELRCDIEDKYRGSSIIQGMVAHMHKQYGPLWVSEDCTYQTYPPPSLHSLLKLVLVPYTDTTSALAIIMYFVLDVSNMQCKGDFLESFCHTFSIPSSFSQQIYGLWLLDHGFVSVCHLLSSHS
ncbi:protein ELYS-like [Pangasianodon hypophthalmus]|uniref:protein ELYS-like n=1 Tax=Pangasianodon hypophthalmus TaxID=310915 RepID=UPI002308040D|nr:protein ELYS-like [Pangasianodon hypophthalmus]